MGFLAGKKALIIGVASKKSIAWELPSPWLAKVQKSH